MPFRPDNVILARFSGGVAPVHAQRSPGMRTATFAPWRHARHYTRLHTTEHEDEMMMACWRRVFTYCGSYVDNSTSTPYRPRETVAYIEGERYAASTVHSPARGLPTPPSVALFQSPEPSINCDLSGASARPPLCGVDAGQCAPRPQMFRS